MKPEELSEQLIGWRRDFHQYPEQGFLEIRTASKVAGVLEKLGYELALGKEVMAEESCMGKPGEEETKQHLEWALENGTDTRYVEYFSEGYTGIVATLRTAQPGPTIAYRVDMDALPIHESEAADHVPNQAGFRSAAAGTMHACGHDSHTAIGLGLATKLAENKDQLSGTIKLIFQPAEEGTRGAKSMAEAGVVDNVDYFIASHIGTGVPHQHFVAASNGFLATSKLNITFKGVAAHAGAKPQEGKNALLAAASAALNMHAITRHSDGSSRVNVGELHAGSGRNIIPDHAMLIAETRGETSEINQYVKEQVQSIVDGAAKMYQLDAKVEVAGEALNCDCSLGVAEILKQCAESHPKIDGALLESSDSSGSEDATYFMDRVQRRGGQATYCIFGTELAAGHHNEKFDIHEDTLLPAVEILFQSAKKIGRISE